MGHESSLQTPDDVAEAIRSELSKPSIKDWVGPTTTVNIRKLDCTRDWRNHLPSLGVKLEGGLLRDDEGNHLFLSMLRRGQAVSNYDVSVFLVALVNWVS